MSDGLRDYHAEIEIVNVDEAERLRAQGMTYAQIAEYFGCSRQAVQQKLLTHRRVRRRWQAVLEGCPYAGLREFMLRRRELSLSRLSSAVFGNGGRSEMEKTRRMLAGRNVSLTVGNVLKLEALTGMPFAELFRREAE
jgi:hypothetical protein